DARERLAERDVAATPGVNAPFLRSASVGGQPVVDARGERRACAGAPVGDVAGAVRVEEVVQRDDLVDGGRELVERAGLPHLEEAGGRRGLVLPVRGLVGERARRRGGEVEVENVAME